jgi:adenylate cyclase
MRVELRGHVSDPSAAWSLVGDTDHLNRLADNPRVRMALVPDDAGFPAVSGEMHGPGPVRHLFEEIDARWVSGQWLEQRRVLTGPILRSTHFLGRLEPAGDGVVPVLSLDVGFAPGVGLIAGPLARKGLAHWQRALDALPPPGRPPADPVLRALPGAVHAALERWRRREVAAALVERTAAWFTAARARELGAIRPFVLAERWGIDRREVVAGFVEGTQVGAFELYWASRCPRCGGPVATVASLSDLADHATCPSCRIGFDNELDRNVEVLFAAHPTLRPKQGEAFCTMYPSARPEVAALTTLDPDSAQEIDVDLTTDGWSIGGGGDEPDTPIRVTPDGPSAVTWRRGAPTEALAVRPGRVHVTMENPTPSRVRVQVASDPDSGRWLSAAWLTTMPEYRRQFGSVALASDVRLAVRAIAVLFTDLTGSAAMYHELGDARAFRFVHDHFAVLDKALAEWRGSRVKTIGDALMATFLDPADALSAAIAMQGDFQRWVATLDLAHPPGLKVGVHFGPAMAVHTDQAGLDYFGGTVNMAARCEGRAVRGQVVWTHEVHSSPGVSARLDATGLEVTSWSSEIKGLPNPVTLFRVTVGV